MHKGNPRGGETQPLLRLHPIGSAQHSTTFVLKPVAKAIQCKQMLHLTVIR